jgi:Fe-S-cluster containining protein
MRAIPGIVRTMEETSTCTACCQQIEVGQAWMEADREGSRVRIHVECLYQDRSSRDADDGAAWEPQERSAS